MKAHQIVSGFGKAATALHKLLHESIPLTHVERDFIKTELDTLDTALKAYNSRNPEPDSPSSDESAEKIL